MSGKVEHRPIVLIDLYGDAIVFPGSILIVGEHTELKNLLESWRKLDEHLADTGNDDGWMPIEDFLHEHGVEVISYRTINL